MITPVSTNNLNFVISAPNKIKIAKVTNGGFANLVSSTEFPSCYYPVSFGQNCENDMETIKAYLHKRKQKLAQKGKSYKDINAYGNRRLEGIQEDIKFLESLTIPQIKFLVNNLMAIMVQRGCNNMCAHCYAKAMPPSYQKTGDKITTIDYEDFQEVCNSFNELNKRFGFNVFEKNKTPYMIPFHDSDCSKIFLKDKNGKIYDYLDIAKKIHEFSAKEIIFDTAGWNIQDKVTQQRMENLVQRVVSSKENSFLEFNLSVNPFHSLYHRSVELEKRGEYVKSQKFRDFYINRLANVLFTLTPLIKTKQLNILSRALPDDVQNVQGYRVKDLNILFDSALHKLSMMYKKDFYLESQKVIKSEEEIEHNIEYLRNSFDDVRTHLGINGRLKELVGDNKDLKKNENGRYFNDANKALNNYLSGLLDINGEFFVTNWYETYKTDIQLDYKTKDKKTAEINPNLRVQKITKDMLTFMD